MNILLIGRAEGLASYNETADSMTSSITTTVEFYIQTFSKFEFDNNKEKIKQELIEFCNFNKIQLAISLSEVVGSLAGFVNEALGNTHMNTEAELNFYADKFEILKFRKEHGYKCQDTYLRVPDINYPVILKDKVGTGGNGAHYIKSSDELSKIITEHNIDVNKVYFEEIMDRVEVIAFHSFVDLDGTPHTHTIDVEKQLVDYPGCHASTIFPNIPDKIGVADKYQHLINTHEKFLKELNIKGSYVSSEYIFDGDDYYFIDLNPRMVGYTYCAGRKMCGLECYEREGLLNLIDHKPINFFGGWNNLNFTVKCVNNSGEIMGFNTQDRDDVVLWTRLKIGDTIPERAVISSLNRYYILYLHRTQDTYWEEICEIEEKLNIKTR